MLYKQEFNSKVMKLVESSCVYIAGRLLQIYVTSEKHVPRSCNFSEDKTKNVQRCKISE